uniref:uncharacterized protein LOC122578920 n=1 Tax=Erigeron canadensis TaxID=72917 RepID=UPI001CB9B598|nr:uncharacterized protein LOC122578920 [Erigeron canadensis]
MESAVTTSDTNVLMYPSTSSSVCVSSSLLMQPQPTSSSSVGVGVAVGAGFIQHIVTKFDTLAGVAIKYGVEVADIKRLNGLTTDLQMFACKSLKIPLPGRHPPSPVIMSNGYHHTQRENSPEITRPNGRYSDSVSPVTSLKLSSSPQRNISSSINSLRDYYGLPAKDHKGVGEGFEMTETSNPILGHHRKSKSDANEFSKIFKMDNGSIASEKGASSDKSIEKLVRRRKSEVDLNNRTPEMLIKQDYEFVPKTVHGTTTESELGASFMIPLGSSDLSTTAHAFSGVRKSSSAPTFQQSETDNNNVSPPPSSTWLASMLNLKADLQGLSIAAIASPLFDGLPKPISGRKSKAARD